MASIGRYHFEAWERRFRELIENGHTPFEAAWIMNVDEGVGAINIRPALQSVAGLTKDEAMRLLAKVLVERQAKTAS